MEINPGTLKVLAQLALDAAKNYRAAYVNYTNQGHPLEAERNMRMACTMEGKAAAYTYIATQMKGESHE